VRDRDSAQQIRIKKEEVAEVVGALVSGASFESLRSP
jgi:glycyl-tRNA synthetase (class II)